VANYQTTNKTLERKGRAWTGDVDRKGDRRCATLTTSTPPPVYRYGPSGTRPEWVELVLDGVRSRISIAAHDAHYLQQKAAFKAEFFRQHPDLHAAKRGAGFRRALTHRREWLLEERRWYWDHGELMPPDWTGKHLAPDGRVRRWPYLRAERKEVPCST
jgi:hypothetical protein